MLCLRVDRFCNLFRAYVVVVCEVVIFLVSSVLLGNKVSELNSACSGLYCSNHDLEVLKWQFFLPPEPREKSSRTRLCSWKVWWIYKGQFIKGRPQWGGRGVWQNWTPADVGGSQMRTSAWGIVLDVEKQELYPTHCFHIIFHVWATLY